MLRQLAGADSGPAGDTAVSEYPGADCDVPTHSSGSSEAVSGVVDERGVVDRG
jgi:hypothetical protein